MSLPELLAAAQPLDGGFAADIPESWHQGRTASGGLSSALALIAAQRAGGAMPPLRSAQISMIAPLYGTVAVTARVLRRGRNATWVAAEITRDGEVALTASFVFMGPVASALRVNDCPPPGGLIAVEDALPMKQDRGAVFLHANFDVRFAQPKDARALGEMCWWVRARDRAELDPMAELLLCADALPPGVMSLLTPQTPVSTMHWQAGLLTPAPATHDGWWLLRSTGDYAEAGCASQRMAIWNSDGAPIMAGMQSLALFG